MINVTKTYLPNKEQYKKYIDEIYANGWVTNNGPMVKLLEQRLAEYLGVKNLVLVSNGTLALEIAYRALGIVGDVITTPYCSHMYEPDCAIKKAVENGEIAPSRFNTYWSLVEDMELQQKTRSKITQYIH